MFNNIGGKIKGLAKFMCWLGIIISVIAGVVLIIAAASSRSYTFDGYGERITISSGGSVVAGILVIVFGSLFFLDRILLHVRIRRTRREQQKGRRQGLEELKASSPERNNSLYSPSTGFKLYLLRLTNS